MTYDVIIIGAGPAGLTAAIYSLRSGLRALLLENPAIMSQAGFASCIENFPGFTEPLSGAELLQRFRKQAIGFGVEIVSVPVKSIAPAKEGKQKIWSVKSDGTEYKGLSIIAASGAEARRLDVPGEKRLCGKGVSYCAVCDGAFFRDKTVAVIGGGNSAVDEALFLTQLAKEVLLVHRRDRLRADNILQKKAQANKKIEFLFDATAEEIIGKNMVEGLKLKDGASGQTKNVNCDGVFISIGYMPNTDFAESLLDLNDKKQIITDIEMKTSQKGIFACGDCRDTTLRQIVTACGDGACAANSCRLYVEDLKGTTY